METRKSPSSDDASPSQVKERSVFSAPPCLLLDSFSVLIGISGSIPPPGWLYCFIHVLIMVGLGGDMLYSLRSPESFEHFIFGNLFVLLAASISVLCLTGMASRLRVLGLLGCIAGVIVYANLGHWIWTHIQFRGASDVPLSIPLFLIFLALLYGLSGLSVLSAMRKKNRREPGRDSQYPLALVVFVSFCALQATFSLPYAIVYIRQALSGIIRNGIAHYFSFYYFCRSCALFSSLAYVVLPLGIIICLWLRKRRILLISLFAWTLFSFGDLLISAHRSMNGLPHYGLTWKAGEFLALSALFLFILKSRRIADWFSQRRPTTVSSAPKRNEG